MLKEVEILVAREPVCSSDYNASNWPSIRTEDALDRSDTVSARNAVLRKHCEVGPRKTMWRLKSHLQRAGNSRDLPRFSLSGEAIRFSARKIGVRKVRLGEDHPNSVVGKPNLAVAQIDGGNPNHGICLRPGRTERSHRPS